MAQLVILQKPKFREPCNRCGECCRRGMCEIGHGLFGGPDDRQCPALEFNGENFSCGLIVRPEFYITPNWSLEDRAKMREYFIPKIIAVLGVGQGCSMEDENGASGKGEE